VTSSIGASVNTGGSNLRQKFVSLPESIFFYFSCKSNAFFGIFSQNNKKRSLVAKEKSGQKTNISKKNIFGIQNYHTFAMS
jgi:hypothetical protein